MSHQGKVVCFECKSDKLCNDSVSGSIICTDCGVIQDAVINLYCEDATDYTPKTSQIGSKSKKKTSHYDEDCDAPVYIKQNPKHKQDNINTPLQQINKQKSHKQKILSKGKAEIRKYCTDLKLVQGVQDEAISIYKSFVQNRKSHSRVGTSELFVAVIYRACKTFNCARTYKELSELTEINYKSIITAAKQLEKTLTNSNTKEDNNTISNTIPKTTKISISNEVIPRIVHSCSLGVKVRTLACKLCKTISIILEGKKPQTVAAASILFAIKYNKELTNETNSFSPNIQKEVAENASISRATLRNTIKILDKQHIHILNEYKQ